MNPIVIAAIVVGIVVVLLVLNSRFPANAEDERDSRQRWSSWFLRGASVDA